MSTLLSNKRLIICFRGLLLLRLKYIPIEANISDDIISMMFFSSPKMSKFPSGKEIVRFGSAHNSASNCMTATFLLIIANESAVYVISGDFLYIKTCIGMSRSTGTPSITS